MVHCGYLLIPFLALLVALAAGRALPTLAAGRVLPTKEMKSIIEDLHGALQKYNSNLKENAHLKSLPFESCKETPAHLNQSTTVAHRLTQYEECTKKLKHLLPDIRNLVITHNNELLQHLQGPEQFSTSSPSSTSPPLEFHAKLKSMQCVDCWIQQVAALRR